MEIEIVEYYPEIATTKKKCKQGTMHVYIIDIGMDIRGIRWIKTKKQWIMLMPHMPALDEGKRVFYPVISFTDIDKMKDLLTQIKQKGLDYITKNVTK